MQCGPASAANSLDWLAFWYGITVIHPHVLGLGCTDAGPDASLVGHMDYYMERVCTSRAVGDGVSDEEMIKGKLRYLYYTGLSALTVEFQAAADGDPPAGNVGAEGLVATRIAGDPTFDFIANAVCLDKDVELGYSQPGGHWVLVVTAGTVGGVPYIEHISDLAQSNEDPNDDQGCEESVFSRLQDTDGDGMLNLIDQPGQPEIDVVVTEWPFGPSRVDEGSWGTIKSMFR